MSGPSYVYNGPANLAELRQVNLAGVQLFFNGYFDLRDLRRVNFEGATIFINGEPGCLSQFKETEDRRLHSSPLVHASSENEDHCHSTNRWRPNSSIDTYRPARESKRGATRTSERTFPRSLICSSWREEEEQGKKTLGFKLGIDEITAKKAKQNSEDVELADTYASDPNRLSPPGRSKSFEDGEVREESQSGNEKIHPARLSLMTDPSSLKRQRSPSSEFVAQRWRPTGANADAVAARPQLFQNGKPVLFPSLRLQAIEGLESQALKKHKSEAVDNLKAALKALESSSQPRKTRKPEAVKNLKAALKTIQSLPLKSQSSEPITGFREMPVHLARPESSQNLTPKYKQNTASTPFVFKGANPAFLQGIGSTISAEEKIKLRTAIHQDTGSGILRNDAKAASLNTHPASDYQRDTVPAIKRLGRIAVPAQLLKLAGEMTLDDIFDPGMKAKTKRMCAMLKNESVRSCHEALLMTKGHYDNAADHLLCKLEWEAKASESDQSHPTLQSPKLIQELIGSTERTKANIAQAKRLYSTAESDLQRERRYFGTATNRTIERLKLSGKALEALYEVATKQSAAEPAIGQKDFLGQSSSNKIENGRVTTNANGHNQSSLFKNPASPKVLNVGTSGGVSDHLMEMTKSENIDITSDDETSDYEHTKAGSKEHERDELFGHFIKVNGIPDSPKEIAGASLTVETELASRIKQEEQNFVACASMDIAPFIKEEEPTEEISVAMDVAEMICDVLAEQDQGNTKLGKPEPASVIKQGTQETATLATTEEIPNIKKEDIRNSTSP